MTSPEVPLTSVLRPELRPRKRNNWPYVTRRALVAVCMGVTALLRTTTEGSSRSGRTASTLVVGLLGGLFLGVVARVWMRFISEDPEFTWPGTLGIVIGFTVFGVIQSIVAIARRRSPRRWKLTIVRVFGGVFMLQLFVAAGAVMLPTVLGTGLAAFRSDWNRVTRGIWLLVAAVPVIFVTNHDLVGKFGWSLHAGVALLWMLAIYALIIAATRFTFAPQVDGWHLPSWAKIVVPAVAAAISLALFKAGGGFK